MFVSECVKEPEFVSRQDYKLMFNHLILQPDWQVCKKKGPGGFNGGIRVGIWADRADVPPILPVHLFELFKQMDMSEVWTVPAV